MLYNTVLLYHGFYALDYRRVQGLLVLVSPHVAGTVAVVHTAPTAHHTAPTAHHTATTAHHSSASTTAAEHDATDARTDQGEDEYDDTDGYAGYFTIGPYCVCIGIGGI